MKPPLRISFVTVFLLYKVGRNGHWPKALQIRQLQILVELRTRYLCSRRITTKIIDIAL